MNDDELKVSLENPETREEAADAIYKRYSSDLKRFAKRRMRNQFAARLCLDDVMQSTWKSFHGSVAALAITDSFWPYLFTILTRKLAKVKERHMAAKRDVRREACLGDLLDKTIPVSINADVAWLRESVSELDGYHRQIIELRLEGFSQKETAQQIAKSVKFVQRYEQSAIRTLKAKFEEDLK